jgi:hypothetical protein
MAIPPFMAAGVGSTPTGMLGGQVDLEQDKREPLLCAPAEAVGCLLEPSPPAGSAPPCTPVIVTRLLVSLSLSLSVAAHLPKSVKECAPR